MLQRSEVRAKYNLAGSGLGDCARAYCCACCEIIQEDKELALRAKSSPQAAGYQKPEGGMTYTPQPGN
jgi:PLAC8 family